MTKSRLLIFCDYYLPGVKAGGPIRSITNLAALFKDQFDITVVTRDRDWGDSRAYANLPDQIDGVKVFYLSPDKLSQDVMKKIISDIQPQLIYLNSLFSFRFSIQLMLFKRRLNCRYIVAPRGELSVGALSLKSFKKKAYLFFAKLLGFYKPVIWHATSETERQDILAIFPKASVRVAQNLSDVKLLDVSKLKNKKLDQTTLVFISRVSAKKNLLFALQQLQHIKGQIIFDIYGPVEDQAYWQRCQQAINQLPDNICVTYQGLLAHEQIGETFSCYHAFIFPTLGENYGHVVVEALAAGCPVMLANTTPWLDLAHKGAGWVLPLDQPKDWQQALQALVCMDEAEHAKLRQCALDYARVVLDNAEVVEANKALFLLV